MVSVRINKYIADNSALSRRQADVAILEGKIKLNNKKVETPGVFVDPANDKVSINGVGIRPSNKTVVYALHKPKGYICSLAKQAPKDKLITDLVPDSPKVHPVGRLDQETEGLIILTNDGELTNRLTHPKYEKEKGYWAVCRSKSSTVLDLQKIAKMLERGVKLGDGVAKAEKVSAVLSPKNDVEFKLSIKEGRKHQVRRMLAVCGLKVIYLRRDSIGQMSLTNLKLKLGHVRMLNQRQVEYLQK